MVSTQVVVDRFKERFEELHTAWLELPDDADTDSRDEVSDALYEHLLLIPPQNYTSPEERAARRLLNFILSRRGWSQEWDHHFDDDSKADIISNLISICGDLLSGKVDE